MNRVRATAKECALALQVLDVEARFTVIACPVRPELTQRRLLLFESRWRGAEDWERFAYFPLIINVAYGEVWQYAALLKGAERALRPKTKIEYPIVWGGTGADFTWALNFLAGGKAKRKT